ncbi:MAG: Fic family protein [Candidatus Peribacteraceae bacterium]|nr:Fic family protein [Candidatus Peribacteraceae bacterium]
MTAHRFEKRLQFDPKTSQEITKLLARIDECKGYWEAFSLLSPEYLKRMKHAVIISSSGSSTRIEGAHLSDEEVEQLLRNAKVRKLATRDEQEVLGYLEIIQEVFESWDAMKFGESLIKHIHASALKYSEKDSRHKGQYKFAPNRVEAVDAKGKVVGIIFDPTPPFLTPKEMQELTEWTQKQFKEQTFHPLLIIANFVYEFLTIHPFQDGNGRTSRILTNLLLLQHGYSFVPYVSHEKLIEDHKVDYYVALKKTTTTWKKKENLAPWMLFILRMFAEQGEMAVQLTKEDQTENLLSENQLAVWKAFADADTLSRKEIAEKTGINIRTVDQALSKLLALKKLVKVGKGRATRYHVIGKR